LSKGVTIPLDILERIFSANHLPDTDKTKHNYRLQPRTAQKPKQLT